MRKELSKINNVRNTFTGTFVRLGIKRGWKGSTLTTVLLTDIKDSEGNVVSDHLWFNYTKGFESINLQENDIIQFEARVTEYLKGYCGYREDVYKPIEWDYKLSYPTKIKKIKVVEETKQAV